MVRVMSWVRVGARSYGGHCPPYYNSVTLLFRLTSLEYLVLEPFQSLVA